MMKDNILKDAEGKKRRQLITTWRESMPPWAVKHEKPFIGHFEKDAVLEKLNKHTNSNSHSTLPSSTFNTDKRRALTSLGRSRSESHFNLEHSKRKNCNSI